MKQPEGEFMAQRPVPAALFGLSLFASAALAADPSDVVGRWEVDAEAMRAQMESMIEMQLQGLPEAQRGQAMAMARSQLDSMVGRMAGEADFQPDGTVVFTSPAQADSAGTWSLDGDEIRFQRAERAPGEPAYVGQIAGDVIEMQPEGGQAGPQKVVFVLRRK
jgi:hypothetical protein